MKDQELPNQEKEDLQLVLEKVVAQQLLVKVELLHQERAVAVLRLKGKGRQQERAQVKEQQLVAQGAQPKLVVKDPVLPNQDQVVVPLVQGKVAVQHQLVMEGQLRVVREVEVLQLLEVVQPQEAVVEVAQLQLEAKVALEDNLVVHHQSQLHAPHAHLLLQAAKLGVRNSVRHACVRK